MTAPKNTYEIVKTAIELQEPVFIWGAPGIGKSDIVKQVASDLKIELRDVRATLLDPVDLRGIPTINGDNKAHWCQPDFLPTKGKGILFLDELNAAPPLVQAACYQLILDRRLGEYELPNGWQVIAAGNRDTDRAVTSRMPSALANRFIHVDMETEVTAWLEWAVENELHFAVRGFIEYRAELLHDFDPKRNDKAFPTPRAWAKVAKIVKLDPSPAIRFDMIKGTIGEGAAAEFSGFLDICQSLPNPNDILKDPENADVPTKPAVLYALCGALAQKATVDNIDRLVTYGERLPGEFAVLMMRDCVRFEKKIQSTKAFSKWAIANKDVLL